MRVAKTDSRTERTVTQGKRKRRSIEAEHVFSEVLHVEKVGQMDLEAALNEVEEYARQLRESPVLDHLLRYKRKVREILLFLVEQSQEVQENSFYDPQGRRRLLVLVETIDQKLEDLTREFLDKHNTNLDLVGRLDEIRGLLLDLQI